MGKKKGNMGMEVRGKKRGAKREGERRGREKREEGSFII